jgi:multidrug transporter EmrE-like cation transporter
VASTLADQTSSPEREPRTAPAPVRDSRRLALQAVLVSVALNAAGQLLFKAARAAQPDASLIALFTRPETWAGIVLYGLSAVVWLWVLSRTHLSYAFPILSLAFPIVVALSAVLFAEPISTMRWIGVGVIMLGVSLLART